MFKQVTTLTEFVLQDERHFKEATGNFTLLMVTIAEAVKNIASHLRHSGLTDIMGKTGSKNEYGDEVEKFDEYANTLLTNMLLQSELVSTVMSEEFDKPKNGKDKKGHYIVCFDPLDGSSNIDVNITLGTIFSIYHKGDSLLQRGTMQVAAGYALYGPSTMFVYTCGKGVHGFTLDPTIGSFLLTNPDIRIPEKGKIFALDAAHVLHYKKNDQQFLLQLQKNGYKQRYVGAMVSDVHRILLQGGVYTYPAFPKAPNGKLRLLFEVNPLSFIIVQAGGAAVSDGKNPLDIKPESLSQTVPIVLGSKRELELYKNLTSR